LFTSDNEIADVTSVVLSADDTPTTERIVKVVVDSHVRCNFYVHNVLVQDKPRVLDTITTGDFEINGNATIDGDLNVDGLTVTPDLVDVAGDLHVRGDIRVDGNAYLSAGVDGVINVGDSNTDSVRLAADVDTDIVPEHKQLLDNNEFTTNNGTTPDGWVITAGGIDNTALLAGRVKSMTMEPLLQPRL
jgi:hypothetical protein